MEDSGVEIYEDIIDYVLYRFHVNTRNYKVYLLTDMEFDVFNVECDVIKSFYYNVSKHPESELNGYGEKFSEMLTKEYGEFFYQSGDDSYISAALIHVNKVHNTINPVSEAIEILNSKNGTNKDVTFLDSMLKDNSSYEYIFLLRKQRDEELRSDMPNKKIYCDVIHEALHMVEHEKPPSKWKFWVNKRKNQYEMDRVTMEIYNDWESGL